MVKIRALNESEESDSLSNDASSEKQNPCDEALLEECFEKYNKALGIIQSVKLGQQSSDADAKKLLLSIKEELEELDINTEASNHLKFSVLKNLGHLNESSSDHYLAALQLDSSDISLWIRAGDRNFKLSNLPLARLCYEQALHMNNRNILATDRLLELYYILHLPLELYDLSLKALNLNRHNKKAMTLLKWSKMFQPNQNSAVTGYVSCGGDDTEIITQLNQLKRKRRCLMENEVNRFKKCRYNITLDTVRTQSLASFGNYIIKIYERFAKQGLTYNSLIDITLNNSLSMMQQVANGSANNQSHSQNSSEPATASCCQDVEMASEGDATSLSDNEKSEILADCNNEEADQIKGNVRGRSSQLFQKNSSFSFAAMLFPNDMGDKRRSSRNRSSQDDTFSFKMKFDELNDLLPETLRICAIEQVLRERKEEMQRNMDRDKSQEEPVLAETNMEPAREDLIIKDVIEAISGSTTNGIDRNNIKLTDLLYLYLNNLSMKKQNTLPDAFLKIYKIYRKLCTLPKDVFVKIGPKDITLGELWFTLTANEILYQPEECSFLLRILGLLEFHLDTNQHKEFLVRLSVILGLNLDYRYLNIALENIEEDTRVYANNRKIITRAYIKTLIDKTNEKLQHENEDPHNSLELIARLAPKSESEMSDREIISLCNAIKSTSLWQKGLDILNQRNDLSHDIIMRTINLCLKNGAKMDAILASKLCKEAILNAKPISWTCLFRGWRNLLTEEEYLSDEVADRMDKFFELGHQTLGKRGSCTADEGEFLMLYVKHLLEEDKDNYVERELLGALNCLFNYPTKKPSSVIGHKTNVVPITWEYAEIIYPYLEPEELPTYMSLLRKAGITSELEVVFKMITTAVPSHLNPANEVKYIESYIEKGEALPTFETKPNFVTKDIFYFLADYYFKNKDFSKAKQFYHCDLVVNPSRFDSWAASALIRANEIDKCFSVSPVTTQNFVEGPFRDLVDSAIRCFKKATDLNPTEPKATLWIEFGNFSYNLTALATRLYTYDDFEEEIEEKTQGDYSKLDTRHKKLYALAKACFKSANSLCKSEEVWLHYYMLGKIYEKVDTFRALDFYIKADRQLFLEGASYPKKISYHNPPNLAYEAMEVHYRINAACLKFLLTTNSITQEHMNRLKKYLTNSQRSSFVEMSGISDLKTHMNNPLVINRDVKVLLDDMIKEVEKDAQFDELVFMCLHGMKRCLVRCDKNFKALYRLAYYYQKIRDSRMAQDILLVRELKTDRRIKNLLARKSSLPAYEAAPPDLQGIDTLFKDRKHGNLFFNIWRIPVEEVDRPGSFEHWMFKCTWLLIRTCISLKDTNVLTTVAFQLSRQPEASKKYLQDRARVLLALYAVKWIVKIITSTIEECRDPEMKLCCVREGISLADKFVKANLFAPKMRDLYDRLHAILQSPQTQLDQQPPRLQPSRVPSSSFN